MPPRTRQKATDGDRSDPIVTTAASSQADTVSAGDRPAAAAAAATTATTASPTTLPAGSSGTGSTASTPASWVKRHRTLPAEDRNRRSRPGPCPPAPRTRPRSTGTPGRGPPARACPRSPPSHRSDRPAATPEEEPQNVRRPARGAPRPPRPDAHRDPPGREDLPPDRVTPPAQPPAAAGTRKKAVTEKLLHSRPAVAYREQWCLRAPPRPSPSFAKKITGRAVPYPTRSRCRRTPPHRNRNHHEKHAHQQRRNHANDAHPEWRLTRRRQGLQASGPRHSLSIQ